MFGGRAGHMDVTADIVPIACALMGWTYRVDARGIMPNAGEVLVGPLGDRVTVSLNPVAGQPCEFDVDAPTLLVAATLAALGLEPVDCGRCPECSRRGGPDEWDQRVFWVERGSKSARRRHDRAIERLRALGWWVRVIASEMPQIGPSGGYTVSTKLTYGMTRPCRACRVAGGPFGQPTGRLLWPVERAVFEAAERGPDSPGEHGLVVATHPGHDGARTALRDLAERWESLAVECHRAAEVMADRGLADGWEEARAIAFAHVPGCEPAPSDAAEVGAWVRAWLAGKCERCAWRKGPMLFERRADARVWCKANGHQTKMITQVAVSGEWGLWLSGPGRWACWGDLAERDPCPCGRTRLLVGPHLPAIEAHIRALWERVSVECECWEASDGSRMKHREDGDGNKGPRPCRDCRGLGRIKPGARA